MVMSENLALKNLTIQNVFVREFEQTMHENFQPALDNTDLRVQHKRGYGDGCIVNKATPENGEDEFLIYRFKYDCAMRLVEENSLDDDSPIVVFELKATFVADYESAIEITNQEDINAFGCEYVGYHVWPYWREFVQSSLQKSGLPIVPLPAYRTSKAAK
jgi:hypothetical protein